MVSLVSWIESMCSCVQCWVDRGYSLLEELHRSVLGLL